MGGINHILLYDISLNNKTATTSNEYILIQQNQVLFQEDQQRTQNEQQLFNQWQYASSRWQHADSEIARLNSQLMDMQKQIDMLKANLPKGRPFLSASRTATPASSRASTPAPVKECDTEYGTDEDELAKETEWIREKHKNKKRKINTTPSPTTIKKNMQTPKKTKKEPLPPPIVVNGIKSYETLYCLMKEHINESSFQMKLINDSTVKMHCRELNDYKEAIKLLKENNLDFYSYGNKQKRPVRVMAKNLHHSCNPSVVGSFLAEKGFKIISAINKLSWKEKKPLNMFMLTFSNEENIEKIMKISHILGYKVEIQPMKGNKLIPQCKKCQAFGHTQNYCCKGPRCVKCAGNHLTVNCEKPHNQRVKCVNCASHIQRITGDAL